MVEFNTTNALMQPRNQNILPTTNSAALNFTSNMMHMEIKMFFMDPV